MTPEQISLIKWTVFTIAFTASTVRHGLGISFLIYAIAVKLTLTP